MRYLSIILGALFLGIITFSCDKNTGTEGDDPASPEDGRVEFTIFYTNDEHGWLEATENSDGAAGLAGFWKTEEGYDGSENYLILSGGDNWTGPAVSTWFMGEPMVEVMNALEYDASAIGNHDFDFTIEVLEERLEQMDFPFLGANIIEKSTGEIPPYIKPYIIKDVRGVKVGIIGLASLSTPTTTFPKNVETLEFLPYAEAVNAYAPRALAEGADFLILIGHICEDEMEQLVPVAKNHKIKIITGGHCHQLVTKEMDGVVLIQSGANMERYAKVEFVYQEEEKTFQDINYSIHKNNQGIIDEEVSAIVENWVEQSNAILDEVIGYADETIYQRSVEMGNMVVDSWLHAFPEAEVALTNSGGIRQDIPAGEITLETIVGLLPFENHIIQLELSGSELLESAPYYIHGGFTTLDGNFLMNGTPISGDSTYTLLTIDYLYSLSSNYFSEYDEDPYNTSVHYRQPVIDWIKSLNTSVSDPLNNYLDDEPRK
ncbi:MAG: bifunctional UDP-sugar hydrolase/5'-nucleotidase [Bacteroidales bacterium]|jgi:2',3'-cyclic-nucleotide 2'-phosphodiesterase (5'-nucleotidase family)|nr:bifunctional UDP-sugar hydrolase/5'-nucleotidase [Bacteroidales bacterium]